MLIGKWRNFEELENDLTMSELTEILSAKIEYDDVQRKFLAALQGVDLNEERETKTTSFDDIKARVFSKGQATNASDIVSLQGINAQQAGFGIGMGLEYTNAKDLENPSW